MLALVAMAIALCLGEVLAAPDLETIKDAKAARPGRPYSITCEVIWRGEPDAYAILPAETDSVEWGKVEVGEVRGYVRDGLNVVSQTILVTPDKKGDFETPEIRIGYMSPEDMQPAESKDASEEPEAPKEFPKLRSAGFELQVRPSPMPLFIVGGVLGLLVVVGLCWAIGRWRAAAKTASATVSQETVKADPEAAGLALHEAKKRRIDGQPYEFYIELAKAAGLLGPDASELCSELRARAQDVGYKGLRPDEVSMDSDYRAVSRLLRKPAVMDEHGPEDDIPNV